MVTTRSRAKSAAHQLTVVDLPDNCLIGVLALLPFRDVHSAMLAHRRLAEVARAPAAELWGTVSLQRMKLQDDMVKPALKRMDGFVRWLRPRAGGVRVLELDVMVKEDTAFDGETRAWKLVSEALALVAPTVEVLRLLWGTKLSPSKWLTSMPHLREVDLVAHSIELGMELGAMKQVKDLWCGAADVTFGCSTDNAAALCCLPIGLSSLSFFHSQLKCLPRALGELTNLKCLDLTQNDSLVPEAYAPLAELTRLQELCASWCNLPALPAALSCLTGLRVLYLHSNFPRQHGSSPSEEEWAAALGPMSRLGMLSLSMCSLPSVPAVVAAMTSLRCLHVEDNPGIVLTNGPYLAGLQELSIDWSTLAGHHMALRRAAALSKLFCCGHHTRVQEPLAYAEPMATWSTPEELESLAALPRLTHFVDVLSQQRSMVLVGSTAALMYALPRRLPHVQIDVLVSENYGWRLTDVLEVERKEGRAEEE